MIPVAMIKKLSRAYTDKRLLSRKLRVRCDGEFWANGFIGFWEKPPETAEYQAGLSENAEKWLDAEQVQVWPVEIRPIEESYARHVVRLSDGNGTDAWLDAGYLGAILRRCPEATFHAGDDIIIAKNSYPFAVCMQMRYNADDPYNEPDWSIKNEDLQAARNLETARALVALLPPRPGRKWRQVTYRGHTLRIKHMGKKGRGQVLHINGHGLMITISLYDGRRISND